MTAPEPHALHPEDPAFIADAIRRDDVGALARLLADDAALDARDARGYSALMLAAYAGSPHAVAYLLARGANPNGRDEAGNTVLIGATLKGSAVVVRMLLEAGADPGLRNREGIDARAVAAAFGRHALIALLDRFVAR